MCNCGISA
ncbi:hypothetical protein F383_04134 [Gossypium arboreum]|uniref:Uncharacterized protein n=1 Tax=Gossypium arboreum TaxID=29729 RepID=A0A0B0NQA4_GOSAR|nr:hypothetical protein F383_04134 [Gossypium arboreum]